jgi:hypothetical protein
VTAEWYDLGQRLYAARSGRPVPRLLGCPAALAGHPVAIRARQDRRARTVTITAAAPGWPEQTAAGEDALDLLGRLGVTITAGEDNWRTLVLADPATLPALAELALTAGPYSRHAAPAAHLAWWADRAGYPGTGAVIDIPAGCAARWITGTTPAAEKHAATWQAWLGTSGDGCAALLGLLFRLQDTRPLELLSPVAKDDAGQWKAARSAYDDHRDWRRPDTPGRAAAGLQARCDAADLYEAALLSDPLWRRRAMHTGHVVTGTVTEATERGPVTIECDRMDARLRDGADIAGWTGEPGDTPAGNARFTGNVTGTSVRAGKLALVIFAGAKNRPAAGRRVTVIPAPPRTGQIAQGRDRMAGLYGSRASWLTTGRRPPAARRDVPLDVIVATADQPDHGDTPGL